MLMNKLKRVVVYIAVGSVTLLGPAMTMGPSVHAAAAPRTSTAAPAPTQMVVNGITFIRIASVSNKTQKFTETVALPPEACGQKAQSCTGTMITTISAATPVAKAKSTGAITPKDYACQQLSTTITQGYSGGIALWYVEHTATFVWDNCSYVHTTFHICTRNNWIIGPGNGYRITYCEPTGNNMAEEDWEVYNPLATFSYWQYILMDIYGNVWEASKPY